WAFEFATTGLHSITYARGTGQLPAGDSTFDFWMRANAPGVVAGSVGTQRGDVTGWLVSVTKSGTLAYLLRPSTGKPIALTGTHMVSTDGAASPLQGFFHRVLLERRGGRFVAYVDGKLDASAHLPAIDVLAAGGALVLGSTSALQPISLTPNQPLVPFGGQTDDFRTYRVAEPPTIDWAKAH